MASLEEIRDNRIEKIKILKDRDINPYPSSCNREYDLGTIITDFENLEKKEEEISLVGRVMSLRPQGGLVFLLFCLFQDHLILQLFLLV